MDNKIIDDIANTFNRDLPSAETMDEYLDKIIPLIRHRSEDLREESYYVGKHWIEMRDEDDFHEMVLHIFNPEREYLNSIDGNFERGEWRHIGNKFMFGFNEGEDDIYKGQVFEMAFMDNQFIILRKHANPKSLERRYFVLVLEPIARKYEWREALELLFNKHQNSNSIYITVLVAIVLIVVIFMLLS